MITQLAPETQQQLRAMCAQMATAQRLEDDIHRELYGHMEDKLLAYLNGEETMTEHDALILVREHFGNPAIIKGLLHCVHPVAAGNHFLRRVVAVICAETIFMFLTGIFITALFLYVPVMAPDAVGALFLYAALPALCRLPAAYLTWVTLRFWQWRLDSGQSAWFLEYPAWVMACIGVGITAAGLVLPIGHASDPTVVPPVDLQWHPEAYTLLLSILFAFCMSLIWIWWCDRPPRLKASILAACGFWAAFELMATLPPVLWTLKALTGTGTDSSAEFTHYLVEGYTAYLTSVALVILVSGLCSMTAYTLQKRKGSGLEMQG